MIRVKVGSGLTSRDTIHTTAQRPDDPIRARWESDAVSLHRFKRFQTVLEGLEI